MVKAIRVIYFNHYLNPLWPGGWKRLCPCHNLANILLGSSSTPMPLSQPDIWALAKNTAHSKLKWNSLMRKKLEWKSVRSEAFVWPLWFFYVIAVYRTDSVHCCNLVNLSSQGWLLLLIICFFPRCLLWCCFSVLYEGDWRNRCVLHSLLWGRTLQYHHVLLRPCKNSFPITSFLTPLQGLLHMKNYTWRMCFLNYIYLLIFYNITRQRYIDIA